MVALAETIRLVGTALGAIGGAFVAVEFFQQPSYIRYDPEFDSYDMDIAPADVTEHTWLGRAGGLLIATGFALLFVGELL